MSHLVSIDAAALAAGQAAGDFAASSAAARARLLRALADALEAERESLVPLAEQETAQLEPNAIGVVEVALQEPLAARPFARARVPGSLVLVDTATHRTSGALLVH